jgi:hypothetical protein
MTELVTRAIHIYMQKDCEGPLQGFKIDPKMMLKRMFDKFQAEYAKEDKILQFIFLNSRILKSETAKEAGVKEGAYVECFNFLNFLLGRNLAEMDGCNIYVHFELRLVDTDCLDGAFRSLLADATIVKTDRDGDKHSVEEYPRFMVMISPGRERAFL